jgi:release factor glutamine methyltransferase
MTFLHRLPPPIRRALRRVASRVVPPLTRRLFLGRTTRARFEGLDLVVEPGVFPPTLFGSTRIVARHLATLPLAGKRVLDVGTGSGALALVAARAGARVVAVDLDPAAVACARDNARRNHLAVDVRESDLLAAAGEEPFDYVVFNPPHFPRPQSTAATRAWHAGDDFDLLGRFATDVSAHLARPNGLAIVALSSDMEVARIVSYFTRANLKSDLVLSVPWLFETYHLYHFSFAPQTRRMADAHR